LQAQDLGHVGAQDHAVALLQLHLRHVAAERGVAPEHVDQAHAVALEDLHLVDVAPDQGGALGHRDLGEELRPRARPAEGRRHRAALGQQAAADEKR
jgi:hypothetical protein